MNLPASIRIRRSARGANTREQVIALLSQEWRAFWRRTSRKLLGEPVYGNPLHEAWTADGEPLDRVTPEQLAKSAPSRHVIVPHGSSR